MAEIEKNTIDETGVSDTMSDKDLLLNLLEAADYKTDDRKKIVIERNGKFLFSFFIRPLSEDELLTIRKKATTYMKNPAGKNLPPVEKEVNFPLLRSWKVVMATVEEDRKKIWGNPGVKEKFNLIQDVETVDILLKGGEKDAVCDKIDEISGYGEGENGVTLEEYAKN